MTNTTGKSFKYKKLIKYMKKEKKLKKTPPPPPAGVKIDQPRIYFQQVSNSLSESCWYSG